MDEDKQNFEFKKFIKIFQTCRTLLDFRIVLSFTCNTRHKKKKRKEIYSFTWVQLQRERQREKLIIKNKNKNKNKNITQKLNCMVFDISLSFLSISFFCVLSSSTLVLSLPLSLVQRYINVRYENVCFTKFRCKLL